ncbi:MAG: glycosyltransferase [Chthoniobacterales bacterium]|nr:glycosyltransferase [Chthoniobacterales bacterium]
MAIPCWCESKRLGKFLTELCDLLACEEFRVRVIVVDDGSGSEEAEKTKGIVNYYREKYPFLMDPLLLSKNRGKGGAIYAGWDLWAGEEWLGFVDADGATPAREVIRMLKAIEEAERSGVKIDGWLASRVKMLGRDVQRTILRHVIGRVYATLSSIITGISVYDSQCGCKFYRAEIVRSIREDLVEERFGFDIELIVLLKHAGANLVEFPVDWHDISGSKVHLVWDSIRMFLTLVKLARKLKRDRSLPH